MRCQCRVVFCFSYRQYRGLVFRFRWGLGAGGFTGRMVTVRERGFFLRRSGKRKKLLLRFSWSGLRLGLSVFAGILLVDDSELGVGKTSFFLLFLS